MAVKFWKARIWTIVLLPTVAAILYAGVSLFKGYLHRQAGFDAEGRSLTAATRPAEVPGTKAVPRRSLPSNALITQIRDDLKRLESDHRSDCRYFSLAHRYNDPACVDGVLERERQAFRELVRLLSPVDRSPLITAIDPERVVFRLGLSDLGWTADQWGELTRHYRYGMSQAGSTDEGLKEADGFVREAIGDSVPLVRADWFVAILVRPPLGGPGGPLGMWSKTPPDDIRFVAESYSGQTLGLDSAARELGVEPGRLHDLIAGDEVLGDAFGLGPLSRGQSVPREWWESDKNLTSPFQEAARRLGLGKPVVRR